MRVICDIYRSSRRDEMYLYVEKRVGLTRVPDVLMEQFGKPSLVTTLLLEPGKRLARADVARVLDAIGEQGFYLQMPPERESLLEQHKREHSHHEL